MLLLHHARERDDLDGNRTRICRETTGCPGPLDDEAMRETEGERTAGFAPARAGWRPAMLLLHHVREGGGDPDGSRTRIGRVKTCRPEPLDDRAGAMKAEDTGVEPAAPERSGAAL